MHVTRSISRALSALLISVFVCGCGSDSPAPPEISQEASIIRGGLLYDIWWIIIDASEPVYTNPQYQGGMTGHVTWRCVECHGWDYKGKDGAYGPGSDHYTGTKGLYESEVDEVYIFTDLMACYPDDADGLEQFTETDLHDLAAFIKHGIIDLSVYIDSVEKQAIDADLETGFSLYESHCAECHGADDPNIADTAIENPWKFFHRVRFGQPGAGMIGVADLYWTLGHIRDVLAFVQTLGGPGTVPPPLISYSTAVQPVFDSVCVECHRGPHPSSNLSLESGSSYGNLVNQGASGFTGTLVIPGDSFNSVLYLRISGNSLGPLMPLGRPPVSPSTIDKISAWIDQGAMSN